MSLPDRKFIFSWDMYGVESIVDITPYEDHDKNQIIEALKGNSPKANPLNGIVHNLILRARYNPQRHYEVYAISCDNSLDEEFWKTQWKEDPQGTAELIRDRGYKLFSDRLTKTPIIT